MTTRYKPPPFSARNARERAAMVKWVHGILDEYYEEYYYDDMLSEAQDACRRRGYKRLALPGARKAARRGDVAYLQGLYPEIKEFIRPRKLKKGEKHARPGRWDRVRQTAKIIQRIWLAHPYYRHRRFPQDGASAREIAAAYYGVDERLVFWKPGGKHKPGARRSKK